MDLLPFEKSVELKEVAPDQFENIHQAWTWRGGKTVGGGLQIGLAAAAAYRTVPDNFVLDSLHTHFLSGPKATIPMQFKVQRITNGRRFTVRQVTVEQGDRLMLNVMFTFVSKSLGEGPAMTHSVTRQSKTNVDKITMDDLEMHRTKFGPLMKFQRFPLIHGNPQEPQTTLYPMVAQIANTIDKPEGDMIHILGIINLSDFHVMDAIPTVHGIPYGQTPIGGPITAWERNDFSFFTSQNHTVHFHLHDGFRADDLTYIEATSPWANGSRGQINTRIFSQDGSLIATCEQESLYMLKPDSESASKSKL